MDAGTQAAAAPELPHTDEDKIEAAKVRITERLAETNGDFVLFVRSCGRAGNPEESGFDKRRGNAAKGVHMSLDLLERTLRPEHLGRCFILLSGEDPDYQSGRYTALLRGTMWEHKVLVGLKGAQHQVRFADLVVPKGTHVITMDDNIKELILGKEALPEGALSELIQKAAAGMTESGLNVWSVNATQNTGRNAEDPNKVQRSRGLIFGALFGFRALHDERRYTKYGQIKDDVERSLRYYTLDGGVLRYAAYVAKKAHPPGAFSKSKGGISSEHTRESYAAEGKSAMEKLAKEFPELIRLPKEGETHNKTLGFVWLSETAESRTASQNARKASDKLFAKYTWASGDKPEAHGAEQRRELMSQIKALKDARKNLKDSDPRVVEAGRLLQIMRAKSNEASKREGRYTKHTLDVDKADAQVEGAAQDHSEIMARLQKEEEAHQRRKRKLLEELAGSAATMAKGGRRAVRVANDMLAGEADAPYQKRRREEAEATDPGDEPQVGDHVEVRQPDGSTAEGDVDRQNGDVYTVILDDSKEVQAKRSEVQVLRQPQ